jgi:hypothetical protein
LGFRATDNLRDGRYGRLALVLALTLWFGVSTFIVIWGLAPGSLRDVPMGVAVGGFLILGFLGTLCAAVVVLVIAPVSWAFDWLADRIPSRRRHDVGRKIRRQIRGPW